MASMTLDEIVTISMLSGDIGVIDAVGQADFRFDSFRAATGFSAATSSR